MGANTPRERRYIGAIEILYTDEGRLNDQTRALAYEQTMEQLAGQPDHPGVRRYIMQSYDAPPLAHRGLSVARQLEGSPPSDPRPAHARTFSPGSDSGSRQFELTSPPAAAWVARAAGEHEAALQLMRSASALEASCQRPSVMPGLLAPAHEHLGELLLERGEPGQALHTFETWLHAEPNRLNALYGAAQASEIMGDLVKAHAFYTTLVELRTSAGSEKIEFAQAIAFLANFNIER